MLLRYKENLACDKSSDATEVLASITWNRESEMFSDIRKKIGKTK